MGGAGSDNETEREQKFILFAANKFEANHVTGWLMSNGFPFKACVGKWQGTTENSWLINARYLTDVERFFEGETCIAHLAEVSDHNLRRVTFQYLDDKHIEFVGHLTEVSKPEFDASEGGTANFSHGRIQYFVIK